MSNIPTQFHDDPYAKVYGERYWKKFNYLEEVITTYETNEDEFNVFPFEAGLGKSRETLHILDRYLKNSKHGWKEARKFLIVKRFEKDITEAIEMLSANGHESIVLGITAKNWNEWKLKSNNIKDYHVVFITHERYIRLCKSPYRESFVQERHTLIIDEKVNFPAYSINKKSYDKAREIIAHQVLQNELDQVFKGINDKLEELSEEPQNISIRTGVIPFKQKVINKFIKIITEDNKELYTQSELSILKEFMNNLKGVYEHSKRAVYNAGTISTCDLDYKHWGLKNNIILDASAVMDGVYYLDRNKFRLIKQGKIIDHSKCIFNIYKSSSSKTSIKENESMLFSEISKEIVRSIRDKKHVLVILHKKNSECLYKRLLEAEVKADEILIHDKGREYEGQKIVINWFGNLIGKNDYKDFEVCWLIGSPNLQHQDYLVHYMNYSNDSTGKKGLRIYNGKFANDTFRMVQEGYLAAEIYQSIKRIQRKPIPEGEFNIVIKDTSVLDKVFEAIGGMDLTINHTTFHFEEIKAKEREQRKKDYTLYEYLSRLHAEGKKGSYDKSSISEATGISKSNLSKYLNKAEILKLVREGKITKSHTKIVIL